MSKSIGWVPDLIFYLGTFFTGSLSINLWNYQANYDNKVSVWVAWYFVGAIWFYALALLIIRRLYRERHIAADQMFPSGLTFYAGLPVCLISLVIGCKVSVLLGLFIAVISIPAYYKLHNIVVPFLTGSGQWDKQMPGKKSWYNKIVYKQGMWIYDHSRFVDVIVRFSPVFVALAVLIFIITCGGPLKMGVKMVFLLSFLEFLFFAYLFGTSKYLNPSPSQASNCLSDGIRILRSIRGLILATPFIVGLLASSEAIFIELMNDIGHDDIITEIAICLTGALISALLSTFIVYIPRAIFSRPFGPLPSVWKFIGAILIIYFARMFFGHLHPIPITEWIFGSSSVKF